MIVVSNSSPLILLARIGFLNALQRIFDTIIVSEEVFEEIVVRGAGLPGAREIKEASWIRTAKVENKELFNQWRHDYHLGSGEIATVILAIEIGADLIFLDERKARVLAESYGLSVIGTIGFLEQLYLRQEISDLRNAYSRLVSEGIWIDQRIINHSLSKFGLLPASKPDAPRSVEKHETARKSGIAYAAAFTLFASVISLGGLGWLLDRWLGTDPWLTVTGLALGAIAGFYQFIKLTSRLQ